MQIDLEKQTPPPLVNSQCSECGALVPAEFQSCDAFMLSAERIGLVRPEEPA